MNDRIKHLIEKFWKDTLTADESRELNSLLEHDDYEFRSELEQQFHKQIIQKQDQHDGDSDETEEKVVSIKWKSIWWAAAAILIAIAGIQLFNNGNENPGISKSSVVAKEIADTSTLMEVKNTTASNIKVRLSDGSVVSLSPNSSLACKKYFDANERNVNLVGKACFKVAKDHKRPFTVFANGLSTTALGTEFEVNTLIKNNIIVRLFEGKVMVCPGDMAAGVSAPLYLTSGESVTYDVIKNTTEVGSFTKGTNSKQIKKYKVKERKSNLIFDFKNEPLKDVFDKLSAASNIRIAYEEAHLKGLYFTGSILESDSIREMIKIISGMNGLNAHDMEDHISISNQ